ncbi:MAG: glycosyltransferase family 4 protein [Bacteroidota bacterium]|nr:glycosyltransferase family 4 protein [Bacteroidota bacterium]
MVSTRKRIALVCFSFSWGGLELSMLRLAEAISERSAAVLFVVPPSSPLHYHASARNLPVVPLAPRWKYGDLLAAKNLACTLKEHAVDVVIMMRSQDIHLAALGTKYFPGIKLVFYQQMNSRYNKRDLFHTWIYSRLSLWMTLTEGMKNDVLEFTRVPREKVNVIALGTDLQRFSPDQCNQYDARKNFGLPQEVTMIGVLARLDPGKGQEVLLRAVPEVVKFHPDAFFVIAGDETAGEPGYKKKLEGLCRSLSIESYVKFLPFTSNVSQLLAALDIFVLPSLCETFGIVVIEAMAMRKPVIATNAGGVPEIITDGKTGLLVEPGDAEELTRAIHRLLNEEALRTSLAHSAYEKAVARFDFSQCVDHLVELVSAV